ncbi:MAG: hypothetical protein CYG61_06045 [Actinobacteria bacterium]|nr:MAG: hypothetical protein CYG61_06045 [Actinomycetota bacterium]
MTTRLNAKRAVAAFAALAGLAVALTASPSAGEGRHQSGGDRAGSRGMARMHELMTEGNPGMARMHELMTEGNPGMARMHEQMMSAR